LRILWASAPQETMSSETTKPLESGFVYVT
jgi:hypothetical protein